MALYAGLVDRSFFFFFNINFALKRFTHGIVFLHFT